MILLSKEEKQKKNDETMRYRMSDRDVFYGGGVVNGARSITLMTDVANRIIARDYNLAAHPSKVLNVRLFVPTHAGDYTEMRGRKLSDENGNVRIEVRQFKVCELPQNPPNPSSIDMLEEPVLCTAVVYEYQL